MTFFISDLSSDLGLTSDLIWESVSIDLQQKVNSIKLRQFEIKSSYFIIKRKIFRSSNVKLHQIILVPNTTRASLIELTFCWRSILTLSHIRSLVSPRSDERSDMKKVMLWSSYHILGTRKHFQKLTNYNIWYR
jgi:hypothetical protein